LIVAVLVGYTTSRPIIVDEHVSRIVVDAPDETAATLLAAQWVASRPGVQMPTSTLITAVVL
jgi:hypothetical protein